MENSAAEITTSWHSYPKIYAIGHRIIFNLFQGPVVIEEKLDGSQFSFGVFNGELRARSKGSQLLIDAPEKMFAAGIETARSLASKLKDGWTYRGEYFQKPKHNVLAYDRIPTGHVMIYDINTGHESYLSYDEKATEAARIGLEVIPLVFSGVVENLDQFKSYLERDSILGGQKVEGVVVKNYSQFAADGKAMMGKYVSEAFKEVMNGEFKAQNPGQADIINVLIHHYKTPARWQKAVQHLRDAGQLLGEPKDIGPLFKELNKDITEECGQEIKDKLFDWAWPKIQRGISAGFANWYKESLLAQAEFSNKEGVTDGSSGQLVKDEIPVDPAEICGSQDRDASLT